MKRSTTIIISAGVLAVGALAMIGLLSMRNAPPRKTPEVLAKSVETEVVHLSTVPASIVAYGRVTSAQPVELYSEVAGTIMKGDIPFKPAQSFKRDDLLLRVDDRQAILDMNSTKSDLLTALATVLPEIKLDFPDEYPVWQNYFDSCEFGRRLTDLPETDNPKIKLFLSRFNVYKLYFAVQNLEIRLDKHYFYAPFDGSIVTASLRAGSTARAGTHLGQIINLEELEVSVPVQLSDIDWIDRGTHVTFTSAELSGEWSGEVKRIGSDIDSRTQTVEVFMDIDNDGQAALLNGVFLEADIPGQSVETGIAVPRRALYEDNFVYLIVNGILEYRQVSIARFETETVIIDGGIAEGDTLVMEPLQGVGPGMPAVARLAQAEEQSN